MNTLVECCDSSPRCEGCPRSQSSSTVYKTKVILVGLVGGFTLGVVARIWMRWISTEPEFSFGGTIAIVVFFTIFATAQSIIHLLRMHIKSKWVIAPRVCGAILTLPLFMAAGAMMFPTVVLASIGVWRPNLNKVVRVILLILSFVIPVIICRDIIADFGWTFGSLGRVLLFVVIYSLFIRVLRPTVAA